MRDFRKFCRPSFSKNPQVGDISVKLKCGEIGVMTEKEYLKVLDFFEVDSFVGEDSPNSSGNIVVINKETGKQATFSVSDYNSIKDQFEIVDIVGSKKTPFNNHEYVDLGLPSGTLWATVNVGASSETEVGNYYKFGETSIYDGTDYNTSAYTQSEDLPLENDAANANFGGNWHIPTRTLWNELINNTTHTWINDYNGSGVSVVKFAKTNDNSIFIIIPTTGSYQDGQLRNSNTGYYWASTLRYGSAEYAVFTENSYFHADWACAYGHGLVVRAVCDSVEGEALATVGDIICHNDTLNINEIFSYQNWLELDDSWDAIDLYGIETFDDDDEVTEERKVIMSNGTIFIIKSTDYSSISSNWEVVDTIALPTPQHDYVEIGGIKWATMNVGATDITDTGLYFEWGNPQGYTTAQIGCDGENKCFDNYFTDYKWTEDGGSTFTKYNGNDYTVLQPSDDAVTAVWGGNWRMPTKEEFEALETATTSAWTADYEGSGIAGIVLTAKDDSSKKLFFPACGYTYYGNIADVNNKGYYWSSSLYSYNIKSAYYCKFNNGNVTTDDNRRSDGMPVRGVLDE